MQLRRRDPSRGTGKTTLSQDLIVVPTEGQLPAIMQGSGRKARDRIEPFRRAP
jgi:hypothetical protein